MKLIKFEKKNCAPCASVSSYLDGKLVEYEKVNPFDGGVNDIELAVKFNVMSVPVTILLDDDGNEVKRSIGFKPEELQEILELLD